MNSRDDDDKILGQTPTFFETPPPEPSEEEKLKALAKLTALEYDKVRKEKAQSLGIRVGVLDEQVALHRVKIHAHEGLVVPAPLKPWRVPVDGAELLDELDEVIDRHVIMSSSSRIAVALWILHSHTHDAATHSPLLVIFSPTKRCGKTTTLRLLIKLVPKPLPSVNVSPAVVFRTVDKHKPTLLVDEADAFIKNNHELRGVLDSGHEREFAFVIRCEGEQNTPTRFSTWAPKVIALIGRMYPTLEDRSIRIKLKRRLPTESIERIPRRKDAFEDLHRRYAPNQALTALFLSGSEIVHKALKSLRCQGCQTSGYPPGKERDISGKSMIELWYRISFKWYSGNGAFPPPELSSVKGGRCNV